MSIIKAFRLKRHDQQPHYRFSVPDASNLTGATFTCTMVDIKTNTKVIDRAATGCVVTDGANKELEYRWQAGDTDSVGTFKIEFEINPVSGGKFTVPVTGTALVRIEGDLDNQ